MTGLLYTEYGYLKVNSPPKTPKELYEFFIEISRTPVKSHVAYIGGIPYVRENWMIYTYLSTTPSNAYNLWFHYQESNPPRWYEVYEKYLIKG